MTRRTKATYIIPAAASVDNTDNTFYNSYTTAQKNFATALGTKLVSSSGTSGSGTTVTMNAPFGHPFQVGTKVIVGGVLGPGSDNFNSPISVGTAIPISTITKSGTTVTVTTSAAHNLVSNFLVNIQGSTAYDTTPDCTIAANQAYSKCTQISGVYITPAASTTAVPITVTSPAVFTYTDPAVPAATPGVGPGTVVPASGIATPFTITSRTNKSFQYTAQGTVGVGGAITSNGWAFDSSDPASMASYVTKDAAIGTGVSTWLSSKCPQFTTQITDPAYVSNVNAINDAYDSVVNTSFITGNPPIAYVNAARKADLTIPLRMYLATVCNGIYDGQLGTTFRGFTPASIGPGGAAFDTNAITPTNVTTWAKYAAVNPSAASAAGTTGIVSGSTSWSTTMVTEPLTGLSLPAYQVAKNYGPGAAFSTGLTVATFKS